MRIGRYLAFAIIAIVVLACVERGRREPAEPRYDAIAPDSLAAIALQSAPSMWWVAGTAGDNLQLASMAVTIELQKPPDPTPDPTPDAGPPRDASPTRDAAPPRDAGLPRDGGQPKDDAPPTVDARPPIDAPPPIDAGPPPDALLTRDAGASGP